MKMNTRNLKRKINRFLRKLLAKPAFHYAMIILGACISMGSAETIGASNYILGIITIVIGCAIAGHAVWFLDEVLGVFVNEEE